MTYSNLLRVALAALLAFPCPALSEVINVRSLSGTSDNGTTDNLPIIQAAVNASTRGDTLYYPGASNCWMQNGTLSLPRQMTIKGDGRVMVPGAGGSVICTNAPTGAVLQADTVDSVTFRDFTIRSNVVRSTGASGIRLYCGAACVNSYSKITNVMISGQPIGVFGEHMAWATIDDAVWSPVQNGVGFWVANPLIVDAGENTIINSKVGGGGVTGFIGIFQQSGSGLRIGKTKILGGAYGYLLAPANGVPFIGGLIGIGDETSFDGQSICNLRMLSPQAGDQIRDIFIGGGTTFFSNGTACHIDIGGNTPGNFQNVNVNGAIFHTQHAAADGGGMIRFGQVQIVNFSGNNLWNEDNSGTGISWGAAGYIAKSGNNCVGWATSGC